MASSESNSHTTHLPSRQAFAEPKTQTLHQQKQNESVCEISEAEESNIVKSMIDGAMTAGSSDLEIFTAHSQRGIAREFLS